MRAPQRGSVKTAPTGAHCFGGGTREGAIDLELDDLALDDLCLLFDAHANRLAERLHKALCDAHLINTSKRCK
jgi:hypothetical protein